VIVVEDDPQGTGDRKSAYHYAATNRPLDDLLTTTPNCAPYSVDDSGVRLFPFTPLPGAKAVSDPAHGITSFTEADHTKPAVTARATYEQLVDTHALGSFANAATTAAAQKAALEPGPRFSACVPSG
jgi:hypothetical protein